jgi:hypothetical protein
VAGGALFTAGHNYGNPEVERRSISAPDSVLSSWQDQHLQAHVDAIALSGDAHSLYVAGDGFVAILPAGDLTAGPSALTMATGHTPTGIAVVGTKLFATSGSEGSLQVWNAATGEHVASLAIPAAVGVALDGSGQHLFTSGADGLLHAFTCK